MYVNTADEENNVGHDHDGLLSLPTPILHELPQAFAMVSIK